MNRETEKKNNRIFVLLMVLVLAAQLGCMMYYGSRKTGFHEDELYTFYSSNRTAGIAFGDRQWLTGEEFARELTVAEGEGYNYGLVKEVQSWDVHPPMYYYLFHTVCSLFPGVFSKWLGIGVNLAGFVLAYLLLAYGSYTLLTERPQSSPKRARTVTFLTCFTWGFCGAVISGVMFIRMYQWLTVWILLSMDIHLRAIKKQEFSWLTFYVPLGITVFFGFLTQYYYLIFHVFLGAAFCLWLVKEKKFRRLAAYVFTCALSLGLAVCRYPASLSQIFRGYRGTEAVSEFSDLTNTGERLTFFAEVFDDYVTNHSLSLWLLVICILALTFVFLQKTGKLKAQRPGTGILLVLFAVLGYYFTVAKTALLLGESSLRYQLPIYGLWLFFLIVGVLFPLWTIADSLKNRETGEKLSRGLCLLLFLVLLLMDGAALRDNRVVFLYEEEAGTKAYVAENANLPVVVFYNDASTQNIWRVADELMEFDRIYLVSEADTAPIEEAEILDSPCVLVYVADHENAQACLEGLLEESEGLSSSRKVGEKGLWSLYELKAQ